MDHLTSCFPFGPYGCYHKPRCKHQKNASTQIIRIRYQILIESLRFCVPRTGLPTGLTPPINKPPLQQLNWAILLCYQSDTKMVSRTFFPFCFPGSHFTQNFIPALDAGTVFLHQEHSLATVRKPAWFSYLFFVSPGPISIIIVIEMVSFRLKL